MTTDDQIQEEKLQYDTKREAEKILQMKKYYLPIKNK